MKAKIVVLLFALFAAVAVAQSAPGKLYIDAISGKTNPEAIPDVDAQLIWLLAAAPVTMAPSEGQPIDRGAATHLLRRTAFPSVKPSESEPLDQVLGGFHSAYDSLVHEFNARIDSVPPNDVWKEYRDFRVKVNTLVAETIRTLNNKFPEDAASLRSEIERAKGGIMFSSYKSSDPNYERERVAPATGFGYLLGALSSSALFHDKAVGWITTVIVGMIPGCPGKPYATVNVDGVVTNGPQLSPVESVYFVHSDKANPEQPNYSHSVQCATGAGKP